VSTLRELIDQYHARQAARSALLTGDAGAGTSEAKSGLNRCEAENLVLSSAPASPEPSFGDVLELYRVNAGLSQNALAHKAGVDPAFINRLEFGRADASRSVVLAIARALNLTPYKRSRLMDAAGYAIRAQEASCQAV
jgi:ribosome-binding protein aMBF1 (putative translation factor)